MAAATLTVPVVAPTGKRSATLTLTSDQATGTVYVVVTESSTTPSHAQILAGTDDNDAVAAWSSSAAAALSNSFSATDIARLPSRLYAHFTQVNAGAEASTPVTSNAFWLHDVSYGTFAANGDTAVITKAYPYLVQTGDFGSGTLTWYYKSATGEWVAISNAAFTAADQQVVQFGTPVSIKGVLTGSTSPDLDWEVL